MNKKPHPKVKNPPLDLYGIFLYFFIRDFLYVSPLSFGTFLKYISAAGDSFVFIQNFLFVLFSGISRTFFHS